jgi:hypothetical protein
MRAQDRAASGGTLRALFSEMSARTACIVTGHLRGRGHRVESQRLECPWTPIASLPGAEPPKDSETGAQ